MNKPWNTQANDRGNEGYDYDSQESGGQGSLNFNFASVGWKDVDAKRYEGGLPAPDPGEHVFQIVKVKGGLQQKGANAGQPYFSCQCMVTDDEGHPTNVGINKFCGMSDQVSERGYCQLSDTKGFIEDIGRTDLFEGDHSMEELVGTEFRAQVTVSKNAKTGEDDVRMKKIEPLSHAEPPPRAAKAAPAPQAARPVRGRVGR